MSDGAHTHHHGGNGVILAVIVGLVLAASSGAIAETVTALARLLVIAVAVLAALALAGGIAAVVIAGRQDQRQHAWLTAAGARDVRAASFPAAATTQPEDELARLRAEIAGLRRQLGQHPAVPAGGGYHQHLHFHADPGQISDLVRRARGDAS